MMITVNRNLWIVCLALTLLTAAAFWGVHNYEFVNLDDDEYVVENQSIQHGFTAEALKWAFTTQTAANWHPITWLSHMLDCRLFGLNPGAHHAVNLLLHILNVLLLFTILNRTTGVVWQSAFAACLFAIHPLRVESVAWVSERKDLLSTLFGMLAVIAYIRYCRRPAIGRYVAVLVLLVLGLMSKPMMVTLPFVLLLMDYWPLERLQTNKETGANPKQAKRASRKYKLSHLIAEKIPLFFLIAISSAVTFIVQQQGGAMGQVSRFPLASRVANAFLSYVMYIWKTVWPSALAPFYPHQGESVSMVYAIASAGLLSGITFLVIRFGRTHKYLPVGWFWYLGMLVPVIGLVQVGEQAFADRYSYLPIVGLFIIVAWFVPELLSRWRYKETALPIASLAVIAALSLCTYRQHRYWRDSIALFEHAIKVTKDNYNAHFFIAESLRLKGRLQEAMGHNAECLRIKPDHCEALNNLGLALMDSGRYDEAIGCFEKAIKLKPHAHVSYGNLGEALRKQGRYDEAIALYRRILKAFNLPQIHLPLAEALRSKGDKDEAIKEYKNFLALEPNNELVHYAAGVLLAEQGKDDEAAAHIQKALETKPDFLEGHSGLGYILARQGDYDRAIRHFNEALRLAPEAPDIHVSLGYVLFRKGSFDLAASEYEKALEMKPDHYVAHNYLGAALLRLGRTREAIEHFNQALMINPGYADARNNLQSILLSRNKNF